MWNIISVGDDDDGGFNICLLDNQTQIFWSCKHPILSLSMQDNVYQPWNLLYKLTMDHLGKIYICTKQIILM